MKKVGVHNRRSKRKLFLVLSKHYLVFIGLKFRDNLTLNIHNLMNNNLYHIIYFNCYFRVFRHVLLSFCWFPYSSRLEISAKLSSNFNHIKTFRRWVLSWIFTVCLSIYRPVPLSACVVIISCQKMVCP